MQDCRRSVRGVAMSGAGGSAAGAGGSAGKKRKAESEVVHVHDDTESDEDENFEKQQQLVQEAIDWVLGVNNRDTRAGWCQNDLINRLASHGVVQQDKQSLDELRRSGLYSSSPASSAAGKNAARWRQWNDDMTRFLIRPSSNFAPHPNSHMSEHFKNVYIEITPEVEQAMNFLLEHARAQAKENLKKVQKSFAQQVREHVVACLFHNEPPYCRFKLAASRPPLLSYGLGVLVDFNWSDDDKQTDHGNMKPWSVMIQTCRKHNGQLLTQYLNHDVDEINVVTRMTAEWFRMAEYRMQHGDYPHPYEGM